MRRPALGKLREPGDGTCHGHGGHDGLWLTESLRRRKARPFRGLELLPKLTFLAVGFECRANVRPQFGCASACLLSRPLGALAPVAADEIDGDGAADAVELIVLNARAASPHELLEARPHPFRLGLVVIPRDLPVPGIAVEGELEIGVPDLRPEIGGGGFRRHVLVEADASMPIALGPHQQPAEKRPPRLERMFDAIILRAPRPPVGFRFGAERRDDVVGAAQRRERRLDARSRRLRRLDEDEFMRVRHDHAGSPLLFLMLRSARSGSPRGRVSKHVLYCDPSRRAARNARSPP